MDSASSSARGYCLTIAFAASAIALSLVHTTSNDADDVLLFMTWATFVPWFVEFVGRPCVRYFILDSSKPDSK